MTRLNGASASHHARILIYTRSAHLRQVFYAFYFLLGDVPLLLGLEFLKHEQFTMDTVDIVLQHKYEDWRIPLVSKLGHKFIKWPACKILFTHSELKKLHLPFFLPTAQKLYDLIMRAMPQQISDETKANPERITKACKACKRYSSKPYRFRVSMSTYDILFNHEVAKDLMRIRGQAILHVVDAQINYQNAVILKR